MVFITRAEKAATLMALVTPVIASSLLLGGCMSSPTYGTDKTATEQLLSDVSNIASVQSKRKAPIDYKPRPELVRPAKGEDLTQLPAPQDDVTSSTNPDWPESPEQRRARLVNEISENRDKPGFDSPIIADEDMAPGANKYNQQPLGESTRRQDSGIRPDAERLNQREEVKKRLAESRQGSATTRKYLSEPPLEYREAAATAPQDDIGEDEYQKTRAAKRAARKKGSSVWRDWMPW